MVSGIDPSELRVAREKAGLTQHELARLVGAAGGERISRWELGTSVPRPDFLVKLAVKPPQHVELGAADLDRGHLGGNVHRKTDRLADERGRGTAESDLHHHTAAWCRLISKTWPLLRRGAGPPISLGQGLPQSGAPQRSRLWTEDADDQDHAGDQSLSAGL